MNDSQAGKPKIAHRKKARSLALQALYQWQLSASPLNEIEAQFRVDTSGKVDWVYFHELLVGVGTKADQLDELYAPLLDRKLSELNPVELALLRLGCFELQERIDIPYKVVINESVELAKKFGATDSHKYINGVLDKLAPRLREPEVKANKQQNLG